MQEQPNSLRERLKVGFLVFFTIIPLIIYLIDCGKAFSEFYLFLALGGGACTLFLHLQTAWQRIASLLLSFVFFILATIWLQMSNNPNAYPELRDQILWNACTTQDEKLDYLEHQRWDHDRAVAVYTSMGQDQAMRELNATVKWGMDRLIPFSGKGYPDAEKYRRYGRLIIALKESDFLTRANATELADQYFVEYPFSALKEDSEDWDIVLAMLDFCSNDCLYHTLLQDREADLPTDIANYIRQLLQK